MKTRLITGYIAGVLISSCAWAVPTFDINNKIDNGLINFININSENSVIPDRTHNIDLPEDPLIRIINESAPNTADESVTVHSTADFITGFNLFTSKSSDNLSAYAFVSNSLDKRMLSGQWDTKTGSDAQFLHSGTVVVPAPGALLLGSIGAVIIGWLRKNRMLSH